MCWVPGIPLEDDAEGTMGPLALMSGAEDGSLIKLLYQQDNKSAGLQRFHRSHLVGEHAAGTSVRAVPLALFCDMFQEYVGKWMGPYLKYEHRAMLRLHFFHGFDEFFQEHVIASLQ